MMLSRRALLTAASAVIPLSSRAQMKNSYTFASYEDAAKTLSQSPVIQQYSQDDLRLRLIQSSRVAQTPKEDLESQIDQLLNNRSAAITEVRNIVAQNTLEWSAPEQEIAQPIAQKVCLYMDKLGIRLPSPVSLALVGKNEYGRSVSYTVDSTVALPKAMNKPPYCEHLLSHEIAHIVLRHASNQEEIYESLGFHKADILFSQELKNKVLVNPDQPDANWYLMVNNIPTLPLPMLAGNHIGVAYVTLDSQMNIISGTDNIIDPHKTPLEIIEAAGGNTPYVPGPAEVAAELFRLGYLRSTNQEVEIKNPAQVDKWNLCCVLDNK